MNDWRAPIHPGEILGEELAEIGMNGLELAKRIEVPNNRIYQILEGKRSITADTALRLAAFLMSVPSSGSICKKPMSWIWHAEPLEIA